MPRSAGTRRFSLSDSDYPVSGKGRRETISLRAFVPNAITSLALCTGLSSAWFALQERWELAAAMILVAGVLDGIDGRIARLLKAQSRFGAELDSLSDVIAFGVSPALLLFLWSLQHMPRFGWTTALFLALCCALRLARYNARMDEGDEPRKSAGYLTGVPAPAGAGIALAPLFVNLATGAEWARMWWLVAPWTLLAAALMLSSVATFGWSSLRLRPSWRFPLLGLIGLYAAALISDPWLTMAGTTMIYLLMIPAAVIAFARVRRSFRQRAEPRG